MSSSAVGREAANGETETAAHRWETVIGLEVHAELLTTTKLFSGAPASFGDEPNTNITPVCLGLPGSLPVLNKYAVEQAIKIGLALNCEICPSVFHRKNYFYPDMPKDYQISQYDEAICRNGRLELITGEIVGIERAHLEEDAGKTMHAGHTSGGDDRIHGASYALLDYNRAGRPLVEIVSRPDISSAVQARMYVEELQAILRTIGASDALLEEGSMRMDANISVRPVGSDELRTRTEVKNLNSLRSLIRAIEYEAQRHIELYEAGEQPQQQTRHWSEDGKTHVLRTKEDENDYRYFAEPDLVLIDPDDEWIERLRAAMPELPATKRERLTDAGVALADTATLIERGHADLVLTAIEKGASAVRAAAIAVNSLGDLTVSDYSTGNFADEFARLVRMEADGALTATQAKQVLAEMIETGVSPEDVAANRGFEPIATDDLTKLVDDAIAADAASWQKYCAGEDKVAGVFVGAVMKATKGQADGKAVTAQLQERRASQL